MSHKERPNIDFDRFEGLIISRRAMSVYISGSLLQEGFVLLGGYLTAIQTANTRASGFEELERLTEALLYRQARVSEP